MKPYPTFVQVLEFYENSIDYSRKQQREFLYHFLAASDKIKGMFLALLSFLIPILQSQAFLDTAKPFCTESDVVKNIPLQTTPMSAFQHGDKYAFLIFQKQKDLTLMFDRIGDLLSTKTVNTHHKYDTDVEGFALTPQDFVNFYNYTDKNKIPLNTQEEKLRQSLLKNGNLSLENGKYTLKKPVYIASAYKGCGVGTAEHELNHLYYDSTPSYKQDVKKLFNSLNDTERKTIRTLLNKLGYDDQNLAVEDNLLGEFSAFFRDPRALRAGYAKEIKGTDPKLLETISQSLLRLEKSNDLFTKCASPAALDEDDTPTSTTPAR